MDSEGANFEELNLDQRAYRFFPLHEEEKHNFNKPNGSRVYYHGQIQHDQFQKKKLAEFQQYLKVKAQNKYDQKYFNAHMLVLFLSANGYKPEETYKAMNEHVEFVKKYVRNEQGIRIIKYETDEKVRKLIDAGFFYVCGRDHHFRPTMVFNLPKTDTKDTDAVLRGIVLVQEEVIQKMFIPGQVECWNIIYDLGGMGLTDIPVNALKGAIQTISANYGGRLYKLWMLNAPGTVYFSWKVVKNFLDPVTVQKIHIIKKNTDEHLWKLFHKDQIEEKYGGTQPNRTKFYPFKIPKAYVDQSRLVTEEKYAHMVESGFLKNNVIDPKYLNKKQKNEAKQAKVQQKKVEAKVEEKKEEVKAQEPKKEELKVEESKKEEPKVEEPKKQQAKVEEPQKQQPKVEQSKQEQSQSPSAPQAALTEQQTTTQTKQKSQQPTEKASE